MTRTAPRDVITIDGPSGAGKSTIARALAERLGWIHLDTGAMYRAVALAAVRKGIPADGGEALGRLCGSLDLRFAEDEEGLRVYLGREDVTSAIRGPEMDQVSSAVSAVPEVRAAMTELQRKLAGGRGLVAEGRDMGTVVFPEAVCKFFLTAAPGVRAERRYRERIARGEKASLAEVNREMRERDRRDASRDLAPLRPAPDAHVIDATDWPPERVLEEVWRRWSGRQGLSGTST